MITAGKQELVQNTGLQAFLQKPCGSKGLWHNACWQQMTHLGQSEKNQGFQPGSNFCNILFSLALISILSSVLLERFIVYFVFMYLLLCTLLFVLETRYDSVVHNVLGPSLLLSP